MRQGHYDVNEVRRFCEDVFCKYGFTREESADISDVLVAADLYGIDSHGVQRLTRYCKAVEDGFIDPKAEITVVKETPLTAVWDGTRTMGQLAAKRAMSTAIEKAKAHGVGAVLVRGSNHFGIAGYYTQMAGNANLMGMCMTNTEAIAVPPNGRKAMLGTSPIALCMPASPVPFWFDAATTTTTRGRVEVYDKTGTPLPHGWAADETGSETDDAGRVIRNIKEHSGGGLYPLGGYKGYGLSIMVELFTSIFSGGTPSPDVRSGGNADTSFTLIAVDYGMFGDKAEIEGRMSDLLQHLRRSPKANGQDRIFTHGEREAETAERLRWEGIPIVEKTIGEMRAIGERLGLDAAAYGL